MQMHTTKNTLCLVGKGWQIKAYMRMFRGSRVSVADFLSLPCSRRVNSTELQQDAAPAQVHAAAPAEAASCIQ
ncbi:MAG: hypothetical protein JWN30_1388 [Bacilli bacterium]|nr:hypothetical protein [Bacilli bacterium]